MPKTPGKMHMHDMVKIFFLFYFFYNNKSLLHKSNNKSLLHKLQPEADVIQYIQ